MTRAELMQLLSIASGYAPPCPNVEVRDGALVRPSRPPTPNEWAAHLLTYALALDLAIEAKVAADERATEEAARLADVYHLNECTPDHCGAGCPDATQRQKPWGSTRRRWTARHEPKCEPGSCVQWCILRTL